MARWLKSTWLWVIGIIGAAIAAIIAGVALEHQDAWASFGTSLLHAIKTFFGAIVYPVPVPAVVMAAIVVAAAVILLRAVKIWRAATKLSESEEIIIKLLAMARGQRLDVHEIEQRASLHPTVVEQAIERLEQIKFIDWITDMYGTPIYGLASAGRSYVIKKGYTK